MRARLLLAHGVPQAVVGTLLLVAAGVLLTRTTVGATRLPLPLVWPLAVLQVMVAQLPLREVLGPAERVAARGRTTRAVRTVVVLVLVGAFLGAVVVPRGDDVLATVLGLLTALGLAGAVPLRAEPWAWTLVPGMLVVALLFVSPFGEPVDAALAAVPSPATSALLVLAVVAYVLVDVPHLPSGRGRR